MTTPRWLLAAAVVLPLLAVRPAGAATGPLSAAADPAPGPRRDGRHGLGRAGLHRAGRGVRRAASQRGHPPGGTVSRIAADVSQKVTGYMFGNLMTSLIAWGPHGGHRHRGRLRRLHPDREPHPEPGGDEQDGANQPAARPHRRAGRGLARQPDRRYVRRLRRGTAGHPASRGAASAGQGGLAGHGPGPAPGIPGASGAIAAVPGA